MNMDTVRILNHGITSIDGFKELQFLKIREIYNAEGTIRNYASILFHTMEALILPYPAGVPAGHTTIELVEKTVAVCYAKWNLIPLAIIDVWEAATYLEGEPVELPVVLIWFHTKERSDMTCFKVVSQGVRYEGNRIKESAKLEEAVPVCVTSGIVGENVFTKIIEKIAEKEGAKKQ